MTTMTEGLRNNSKNCTGCGACYQVCPVDAIRMLPDAKGFYRPVVAEAFCINCSKCEIICPVLHPIVNNSTRPDCYAAWAGDELREKSSAGGLFTLLSQHILSSGGVVFGAIWTDDFYIKHVCAHSEAEIAAMRKSKYLQSSTCKTFLEVRDFLNSDIPVLYTGCPCQIAGLRKFIGNNDSNLFTADLICTEASSPALFRRYLDENYNMEEVLSYSFRDKSKGWCCDTVKVLLKDGTELVESSEKDSFQKAFHSRLLINSCCMECEFANLPRQGDLSIGDFWGIAEFDKSLDDNKGTSVVLVNSDKGKKLFAAIRENLVLCRKVPYEWSMKRNRVGNRIVSGNPGQNRFWELIKDHSFNDSVRQALENRYDIGLVGVWNSSNHGSNMTYYALYRVLKDMGLSVMMIDRAADASAEIFKAEPYLFETSPYDRFDLLSPYANKKAMKSLNARCNTFVLGSDQLLNAGLYSVFGGHVSMSWVRSNKKIISYAASFGHDFFFGNDYQRAEIAFFLRRFDYLSVRETSGVKVAKKYFAVEATQVLDPVFLCDQSHYMDLIARGKKRLPDHAYISSYIVDPSPEIAEILNLAGRKLGIPIVAMSDAQYKPDYLNNMWQTETLLGVTNEEWLANFYYSEFCIIDSFHGMCFAIMFRKPFIVILNKIRGSTRFTSLLRQVGLMSRAINSIKDLENSDQIFGQIDYDAVYKLLDAEISRSYVWLKRALSTDLPKKAFTAYDILDDRCDHLVNEYNNRVDNLNIELKRELDFYRNSLNECRRKLGLEDLVYSKETENRNNIKKKTIIDHLRRSMEFAISRSIKDLIKRLKK